MNTVEINEKIERLKNDYFSFSLIVIRQLENGNNLCIT